MSKSVVTAAAAAAHAKRVEKGKKLAKQQEVQQQATDEAQAAGHKEEAANAVQTESELRLQDSMSHAPLGDFSFAGALANAAASASSLTSEVAVQGESGGSDGEGDGSGTILLVGAVALVGAGVAALASGGGGGHVAPANTPPVLADITAKTTAEDTAVTFPVSGTDADGDTLTFSVGSVTGGTATVANGSVTFTPTANFAGAASLVVTVADGKGGTDTQTVAITVTEVNDAPVPSSTNSTTITVAEDDADGQEFFIDFTDDTSTDAQMTVQLVTAPTKGTFSSDGTHYIPNANANGSDSFTYRVVDKDGLASAPVTVAVTITPVNDAPVLAAIADQGTNVDTALTFPVSATDIDVGDTLTFTVGTVVGGTAAVNNGQVTFTPNAGFTGAASVVVNVSDGTATDNQTVAITVAPGAGEPDPVSIDVGVPANATPVTISADGEDFVFTDNANVNTNVLITNFTAGDTIVVTNANVGDYTFGTGSGANAEDLIITYSNPNGTQTIITLDNVGIDGFVLGDYGSLSTPFTAVAALGFEFMTFA